MLFHFLCFCLCLSVSLSLFLYLSLSPLTFLVPLISFSSVLFLSFLPPSYSLIVLPSTISPLLTRCLVNAFLVFYTQLPSRLVVLASSLAQSINIFHSHFELTYHLSLTVENPFFLFIYAANVHFFVLLFSRKASFYCVVERHFPVVYV